jgi:hypothetical protein
MDQLVKFFFCFFKKQYLCKIIKRLREYQEKQLHFSSQKRTIVTAIIIIIAEMFLTSYPTELSVLIPDNKRFGYLFRFTP